MGGKMALCDIGTCLCIHHLQVVFWQVGDDHFEGVQDRQGARGGEVQVCPDVEIQNVQWQLSTCSGDAYLPAEVVDTLHCVQEHAFKGTAHHSTAQHDAAQRGAAQHGTAKQAPHRTAQHSTAQHSTAQHSTAQQAPAQPSIRQRSKAC